MRPEAGAGVLELVAQLAAVAVWVLVMAAMTRGMLAAAYGGWEDRARSYVLAVRELLSADVRSAVPGSVSGSPGLLYLRVVEGETRERCVEWTVNSARLLARRWDCAAPPPAWADPLDGPGGGPGEGLLFPLAGLCAQADSRGVFLVALYDTSSCTSMIRAQNPLLGVLTVRAGSRDLLMGPVVVARRAH